MMHQRLIKLNVRKLHHMEVPKLVSRFIGDYEASKVKLTDEDFRKLFSRLKTKLESFVALERPITHHTDKRALREADMIRDNDIKALMTSVNAFRASRRRDEADAYSSLMVLLKSYRAITKRNYEEESFAIEDLLTKLKKEPYRTQVTTLDVNKWVTNLTESQRQFESLFATTTTKKATATKTATINQARHELFEEYQRLCEYVDSMVWVKGSDNYKKTLDLINKSRQFYIDMIGRRSGKTKKSDNAMTDTDTTTTEDTPPEVAESSDHGEGETVQAEDQQVDKESTSTTA